MIHLAPVLAVIALGAWVFASPIGAAPDDDFHLTSTWCANELRTDLCEAGPTAGERTVAPVVLHAACFAFDPSITGACQKELLEQPFSPSEVTARGSFLANYPPVYYAFMSIFASSDLLVSALLMRFVTVLMFVGLTVALYCLLPVARRSSLLWGWLITIIPLGLFLIASNNPSSWAIVGVGTSWLALVGYFETTGRRRIALGALFGLAVVIASGARADAALYTVMGSAVAVLLTMRRERAYYLMLILPAVLGIIAALFFLSSRQSTVVVSGLADSTLPVVEQSAFGMLASNLLNIPQLWVGVFGGWPLGWLDTALPSVVTYAGLGAFIAVVFVGLGIVSRRKVLAVSALVLALWLVPAYVLQQGGDVVGRNVQPRYLLPLIVMFAGVAVFEVGRRQLSLGRVQVLLLGVALSISQAFALHFNLRRYVAGVDAQGGNLDAGYAWWWDRFPLTPMGLWIVGSLAFTGLVIVLLRDLRRHHDEVSSQYSVQ